MLDAKFHSQFGGNWIDRLDFPERLRARVSKGSLSPDLAEAIQQFERDGYHILRGAASDADIDRFESALSGAFRDGHDTLIAQDKHATRLPVVAGMDRRGIRVVDSFVPLPAALDLFASPRLATFMTAIFEDRPLLFQSLSFDLGSEQGLHQDTAYVVVNKPMEMLACWIALEDVAPGSGELQYMVGSHRLGDFAGFAPKKHWNSEIDGNDPHWRWFEWISEEGARRNMPVEKFMAKRGDILIWHADLAHGGSPITDLSLTRKSLVGHFCPAAARPNYFGYRSDRGTQLRHGPIDYSSEYYDLAEKRRG